MQVTAIKTSLVYKNDNVFTLIKSSLDKISNNSVLVITSKIVSLCEGSVRNKNVDKQKLIETEAEWFTDPHSSKYNITLTIKNNLLAVSAGIDESNIKDGYVLLPKNPQKSANDIWQFLKDEYEIENVGVVITDSTSMPLKWGTVGRSLSHCGFKALKNLIGQPDLFGRLLKMSQMNIAEGIAASAVLEMGEANESTPLAIVTDIEHIEYQDHIPTKQELADLKIRPEDDIYAPILMSADWKS